MKRFSSLAAVAGILGLVASGCHAPQTGSGGPLPPAETKPPSAHDHAAASPAKITVYVVNSKPTGDQDILIPREITPTHPAEPVRDAITALLKSPDSPIPSGTALRGVTVNKGLATVDFSRSPVNETGGESSQSTALNALSMTLGQFPEISAYQIKVQGQDVKTFGEFSTDGPIDVIRPGTALEAKRQ